MGAGEIVVSRSYFDNQLAEFFDNPRNFQASVIKEKQLDEHAERAILEKRLKEADKLLPQIKSKAMAQDVVTEKERIQTRLKDLETRRDFLTKEKERFRKKAS